MIFKSGPEQMHILFLPRWYPNRFDPMPGLFAQRHGQAVSSYANISVLYVHPVEKQNETKYKLDISEEYGLFTTAVYVRKSKNPVKLFSKIVDLYRYISAHLIGFSQIKKYRGEPDLLHVHILTRLGFLAYLFNILNGTPYLISEHWTRYLPVRKDFNGAFRKIITRLVTKKAKAVITVSKDLKEAMLSYKLKNKNYLILPNVVDTELFKPDKEANRSEKKHFVHVSCFVDSHKNISGILRVLKKLREKRDDFDCTLIGEGPDMEYLKTYSKTLGLDDVVKFTGLLEGENLVNILNTTDAMLMFSNHENLPVVMLESYACGIPVISTKVGGIHEHMNKDLGYLVERGNEEEFLSTLNSFLDHVDNFDKQKIRDYAVQNFSNEVVGKKLYEIYLSILENK